MNKYNTLKEITIAVLVAATLAFGTYKFFSFKAERYNATMGTNFTAVDIMLGIHKSVRNYRE